MFDHFKARNGTSPTVKLLLSREFVYDIGLNDLWITWKEFVPLPYPAKIPYFLRCFPSESRTQDDHSAFQNRSEPVGKTRNKHRFLQEYSGNRQKWKQYSRPEYCRFFRWIPTVSHWKEQGFYRKTPEKAEIFRPGILLPWNLRNFMDPSISLPDCSTWVVFPFRTSGKGEFRISNWNVAYEQNSVRIVYCENFSSFDCSYPKIQL